MIDAPVNPSIGSLGVGFGILGGLLPTNLASRHIGWDPPYSPMDGLSVLLLYGIRTPLGFL